MTFDTSLRMKQGKPCLRCGDTLKYRSTGGCVTCAKRPHGGSVKDIRRTFLTNQLMRDRITRAWSTKESW